jgi:hypothetical protein
MGDVIGSGTVSGPTVSEAGALIELTLNGAAPVELATGEKRSFLADGDTVALRGNCEKRGFARIGFGECRAGVLPISGVEAASALMSCCRDASVPRLPTATPSRISAILADTWSAAMTSVVSKMTQFGVGQSPLPAVHRELANALSRIFCR